MGHGTQEKRGNGRTKKGEQTGKKSGGRKRDRERERESLSAKWLI